MSQLGQNRKGSDRAHVFRFSPVSRHQRVAAALPDRAGAAV